MAKQVRQKKKRPRVGGVTKFLILLLLIAVGWRLYGLQTQVANAQAERDRYLEAVENLRRENEILSADIDGGATQEKMEEIARRELGLVLPNEYVFYNTSN